MLILQQQKNYVINVTARRKIPIGWGSARAGYGLILQATGFQARAAGSNSGLFNENDDNVKLTDSITNIMKI